MSRVVLFLLFVVMLVAAQTATEVEITAEPSHHLEFENEYVRVFKVEAAAHAATLMHRHRHDYLFVTLGDSQVRNEVEGRPAIELKLADGETRFVAGGFAHIARNLSNQPFRNITIELMQDKKVTNVASSQAEGHADRSLPGFHSQVVCVKDGARVTEVELQPGATVPTHHHDGPHLVVAVSDLDLRSDVENRGSTPARLKAGDVKWVPGGFTHSLTNLGTTVARLVTVEFTADRN